MTNGPSFTGVPPPPPPPLLLILLACPRSVSSGVPSPSNPPIFYPCPRAGHLVHPPPPLHPNKTPLPTELVTVIRHRPASNENDTYYAVADASRAWIVQLDPDYFSAADNNLTLYIFGSVEPVNTLTIRDVVYGDVFLCSGQS